MEQSPSREDKRSSATPDFPRILWNAMVYCRLHKSPPPVPLLGQINSIHVPSNFLKSILMLSSHLFLSIPSSLVPSVLPTQSLYAPLLCPIHATCFAHLILDFITPLGPNLFLSNLSSNTLGVFLPQRE